MVPEFSLTYVKIPRFTEFIGFVEFIGLVDFIGFIEFIGIVGLPYRMNSYPKFRLHG